MTEFRVFIQLSVIQAQYALAHAEIRSGRGGSQLQNDEDVRSYDVQISTDHSNWLTCCESHCHVRQIIPLVILRLMDHCGSKVYVYGVIYNANARTYATNFSAPSLGDSCSKWR